MTCPACLPMCAITEAQLAIRLCNMEALPDAAVNPCSQCGGTDWATTREMIKEEPPTRRWQWLREPPSWRVIRDIALVVVLLTLVAAIMEEQTWLRLVDAFICGFTLAAAMNAHRMISLMKSLDRIREAFDEMRTLNQALMENRVKMHVEGMLRGDDDDRPLAPKLR